MSTGNAQIKSIVERIERLDEEAEALSNDKRDIYAEAKGNGFDVPALKTVIARRRKRRKDPNKYEETESIVETYEAALESGTRIATRAGARSGKIEPSGNPGELPPRQPLEKFEPLAADQSFGNSEQLASAPEKPADAIKPASGIAQGRGSIIDPDGGTTRRVTVVTADPRLAIPADLSVPSFLDRRKPQEAAS